MTREIFKTSKY